ncbi:MAG: 2'-5' RNA ligase family protein [Pseudonocardiales bacterium]
MSRRIGVAIPIPEPWAGELTSWRAKVGDPQAESVPAHVTLLAPTDLVDEAAAAAEEHLASVARAQAPFELHLRGTGSFRPVSDVVFVAVASGIAECEVLEAAVRSGAMHREAQFPYHPHVTVAQALPDEALDRAYDGLAKFEARFDVGGFTLYEHGTDGVWRPHRGFSFGD